VSARRLSAAADSAAPQGCAGQGSAEASGFTAVEGPVAAASPIAAAGPVAGRGSVAAELIAAVREIAGSVPDPELPMLTLADLGILRGVTLDAARVVVSLTPTYTGCPALREMHQDVSRRLAAAGFGDVEVRTVLSPPWSSDSITAEGRRKLAAAGIAPPGAAPRRAAGPVPLTLTVGRADVTCPSCGSPDTRLTAAFGATACRDLYRCAACSEPFEHVKEI
jgi:ring-1,2-phenylacetyl-CoA epoxidase subunit PaaD